MKPNKENPKPSTWQKGQTGNHLQLSQSRDHLRAKH